MLKHIPKLNIVWNVINPKNPEQITNPSVLLDFNDIVQILKIRKNNNKTIDIHPINPSSSPATEKIKSLS